MTSPRSFLPPARGATGSSSTCWRPGTVSTPLPAPSGRAGSSAGTSPTTTQLSRFVESVRVHGGFTEPTAWESLGAPDWHVEGLAVRPGHKMIGHTAFLVTARRMAPGSGHLARAGGRLPAPTARTTPGRGRPTCRTSRRRKLMNAEAREASRSCCSRSATEERAALEEHAAFVRFLGVTPDQLHPDRARHRAVAGRSTWTTGPGSSSAVERSTRRMRRTSSPMPSAGPSATSSRLLDDVVARDFPFLGAAPTASAASAGTRVRSSTGAFRSRSARSAWS